MSIADLHRGRAEAGWPSPRDVLEGLGVGRESEVATMVKKLAPRWFVVREPGATKPTLLYPRWAMSYLRGPMTGSEIRRARDVAPGAAGPGTSEQEVPDRPSAP